MRNKVNAFLALGHYLQVNWHKGILILFILFPKGLLFSQWVHSIGGSESDWGYDVVVDGSGNVYMTGRFQGSNVDFDPGVGTANLSSNGSWDIFFAKYNSGGEYQWAHSIGGSSIDYGRALAVDGSDNVYITGNFSGSNVDFDPGAGTTNLSSNGSNDIFFAKYNSSGEYRWAHSIGGSGEDNGNGIVLDGSGNIYITGYFSGSNVDFDPGVGTANLSSNGNYDIFFAKYNSSEEYQWAHSIGGSGWDYGSDIRVDGSDYVYIIGNFQESNVDFDPGVGTINLSSNGSEDIFVTKYNSSGKYQWAHSIGGSGYDYGNDIAVDGSSNIYITGHLYSSNVDFDPGVGTANLSSNDAADIFFAKYNSSGAHQWAHSIGGSGVDGGNGIAVDGSGNIYITGYFEESNVDFDPGVGTTNLSSNGNYDIFFGKYTQLGDLDNTPPAIPSGLVATPGNTQVTLTWIANSESDLASYKVYGGTSSSPTILLSTVTSGQTYTHSGLTNGTTYYYRITAVDNAGNESGYSSEESATPLPTVQFSAASSSGPESNTAVNLGVSLSAASSSTVTVDYAVTGGIATGDGTDYFLSDGTLSFSAGDTYEQINLNVVNDALDENDETVIVTLSNPVNTTLGTNTIHTYTISDDDPTPTIQFTTTSSSGSESVSPVSFQLTLSAVSGRDVSVNYSFSGTATSGGTDYTMYTGSATITQGNTTSNLITATIVDDALDENDETIIVTISNPTNATLGANTTHTYTITDNDDPPTVQFSSTTSNGSEGTTPANLAVSLSAASGLNVTVEFTVSGGSATGDGTDYTLASGTLTISAGSTSSNISATIVDDGLDENDETIMVTISNPSNASLGTNTTHTYTIIDNDDPPTVTVSSTASSPTNTSPIPITVTFSQSVTGFVSSDIILTNGTINNFSGSGTTYTFNVTPTKMGAVTVDIPANIAQDANSNGNSAKRFAIAYIPLGIPALGLQPQASHTIGLHADGTVYTWGHNDNGQLGDNTATDRSTPVRVLKGDYSGTTYLGDDSNNKIIAVALGHGHSIALAVDGTVYTWGHNDNGQLGDNTTIDRSTPVRVLKGAYSGTTYLGDDSNNKIIAVALGYKHSIALAADGTIYTWGRNRNGQLGDNTTTDRSTPVKVLKGVYSGTTYIGDDSNNKIIAVALGWNHSVALAADGTVYTWGHNYQGQLGDNTTNNSSTPVKVLKGAYSGTTYLGDDPNNKIIAVALSWQHSITLAADGTVYTWGRNQYGQLGDNTTNNSSIPVKVLKGAYSGTTYLGDDSNNKIITVALGFVHSIALAADGTVYAWGSNGVGPLGDNTTTNRSTPVKVLKGAYSGTTYLGDDYNNKIIAVALGASYSVALAADGTVYTWGSNSYGRLGDNTTTSALTPTKVHGVGNVGYLTLEVDVTAPTVTISSSASSPTNTSPIPIAVTFSESVTGFESSDIIMTNGTISNFSGSGTTYTFNVTPSRTGGVTVDIPANVAQDANSNKNYAKRFTIAYIPLDTPALGPQFSADHTIGLHADGTVYTWGKNLHGQLGDNTTESRSIPVKVLKGAYPGTTYLGDDSNNRIIAVAGGGAHSIALATDGTVYTWGKNMYGRLGDNTTSNRSTPVKVLKGDYSGTTYLGDDSNNRIIAVAGGVTHSIALVVDGTVYTWGSNGIGQLGDNTTTNRSTPVKVLKGAYSGTTYLGDDSNNKIIAVALGWDHSIALAADGTVYTWGDNGPGGKLGDNTTNNSPIPVKVLKGAYSGTTYLGDDSNNKIIAVALGGSHSTALAADGTVYTWGYNNAGQLGDNTTAFNRLTPVKVLKGGYSGTTYLGDDPNNKIMVVALGGYHSIALEANGTVYTWGSNYNGQLGDNTTSNRSTPVKVLKGTYSGTTYLGDDSNNEIISVALGESHSVALATDGTVYTWGDNGSEGKLGDNTPTDRSTPIKVHGVGNVGYLTLGVDLTVPSIPQNLSANPGNTQVTLSWTANTESDLAKYRVYRSTSSGFTPSSGNKIAEPTNNSYTDVGLTNGTTYYYKISAIDNTGNESGYSNEVSATPLFRVTYFVPNSGITGIGVTIYGVGFSTTSSDNTVKFGDVSATVSSSSSITLKVSVPSGIVGPVSVSVSIGGVTDTSAKLFTVIPIRTDKTIFGSQQVITTLADAAYSVHSADLDGDGDMDVLSASYIDDKIAWYENKEAPPAATVTSLSPEDNATGVALNTNLTITFSENVVKGTGYITIKKVSHDSNVEVIDVTTDRVTISGAVVTVDPENDFENNTEYYVLIDSTSFDDLYGNDFAGILDKTTWNFTTMASADTESPSAASAIVNDGSGDDVDYQNSITSIAANWTGFTDNVGIVSYDWAIGTTSGGTGIQDWTATGNITNVTNSSLTLANGQTYYVSVRAVDGAGNVSSVVSSDGVTVDAMGPTVIISSTVEIGTNTSPIPITITFSETVTGFEADDVTIGNGSLTSGSFSGSGLSYSFFVTPAEDDTVTIDIASDAAQDIAGNGNLTATQFNIIYDTTPPTVGTVNDGTGSDKDSQTSTSTIEANWSGFSDEGSGIVFYEWAIGTTSGGTNVQNWTDAGNITSVTNSSLSLTDGTTYYISVRAEDNAGNVSSIVTSDGVTVTTTLTTVSISSDISTATNTSPIPVTVTFSTEVTAFETSDVTVGNGTLSSFSGSGTTYTFDVIPSNDGTVTVDIGESVAQDAGGNYNTAAIQFSIIYDNTPPLIGVVNDGSGDDIDFQASTTTIEANWSGFSDEGSSIALYELAIGTNTGLSDVMYWTDVGLTTQSMISSLSLTDGMTYYVSVRAKDEAGNESQAVNSDGVMVSAAAPSVSISSTESSPTNVSYVPIEVSFSEPVTGFDQNDISVGNGYVAIGSFSESDDSTYSFTVIPFGEGKVTIDIGDQVAQDDSGNDNTTAIQFNITYDGTAPSSGIVIDGLMEDSDWINDTSTLTATWSGFSDVLSGIQQYEYAIGITQSGTQTIDWTSTGTDTSMTQTDLSLTNEVTYYISVRATDMAGNVSAISSSDGITVDTEQPLTGIVLDGLDEDVDWTNSSTTLSANCTGFGDALSGISSYEYAIGTDPSETDLVDWTQIELDTSFTRDDLLLSNGITYFVSIRATDVVGNVSDEVSSDGITVDTASPVVDSVIEDPSGTMEDVDWLAQGQNVDIRWSGFDNGIINRYEFSISTTPGNENILSWTAVGIKTDTTLIGLNINEGIQYYSNVRAVDMADNISNITSSDGFQIDASPPTTGSIYDGLVEDIDYSESPDSISCNWSGFEDSKSGISHYEVALGSISGGIDILDFMDAGSDNSFSQTGLSLDHGNTYYASVRAVDSVGNVSDFVSSDGFVVDIYPGPPTFVESTPDTESYLPLTQNSQIVIKFSEPVSYYELGLESFLDFDIQYDESQSMDSLVINIEPPLSSWDTIQVSLENVTDLGGQVSEPMTYSFYSELLGDYTSDLKVDINDLPIFVNSWTDKDYFLELGPVSGEIPHFVPQVDSTYNLRDAMVFARMWNWSYEQSGLLAVARPLFGEEPQIIQSGQNLVINIPREASSGQIILQYPQVSTDIRLAEEEITEERLLLSKKESGMGQLLVDFGYLNNKENKKIFFDTEYFTRNTSSLTISYMFFSADQGIISQGTKTIELKAIPEKFALHQNYPNPFNPYTTILYDLPIDSRLSLVIYDILGREVRTLINEDKVAGYYSLVWDGKDRIGVPAGTGVYIYRIRTRGLDGGSYSKTRKMLMLK